MTFLGKEERRDRSPEKTQVAFSRSEGCSSSFSLLQETARESPGLDTDAKGTGHQCGPVLRPALLLQAFIFLCFFPGTLRKWLPTGPIVLAPGRRWERNFWAFFTSVLRTGQLFTLTSNTPKLPQCMNSPTFIGDKAH